MEHKVRKNLELPKDMAAYRVLEIRDKLINKGNPYWKVEKKILGLWWSEYFGVHSENGATFYDRDTAIDWYEYHCDESTRERVKVIAQNR